MSRYYQVSQAEMETFLLPRGFIKMSIPGTSELVYGKRIQRGQHPISIRIYTTINPSGEARDCGEDAIRVRLYTLFQDEPIPVGKTQKILRIKTWAKNLTKALNKCDSLVRICPACGNLQTVRKGVHGEFWGCSTYKYTKCSGKKAPVTPNQTNSIN